MSVPKLEALLDALASSASAPKRKSPRRIPHRFDKGFEEKFCTRCDTWKGVVDYNKCQSNKDGLERRCRTCSREIYYAAAVPKGKYKDLLGQRFGRLVVVERISYEPNTRSYWRCSCDCGKELITRQHNLTQKHTKSCGCWKSESTSLRLRKADSAFNQVWSGYLKGARERGLSFELTEDQFRKLNAGNCFYCGVPPASARRRASGEYIYNGIDRVDNTVGYVESNCVSCCFECNSAKSAMTQDKFLSLVKRIYEHSLLQEEKYASYSY